MKTELQDVAVEAAKATPAIGATLLSLNGFIAIATALLIVLQIAYLVRKWIREETAWGQRLKRGLTKKKGEPETDYGSL